MEFAKEINRELKLAIASYRTSILRIELVEFYESFGKFHMIFNTFGWKSTPNEHGDFDAHKIGWWSHFTVNIDGSPCMQVVGCSSILLPVMMGVYQRKMNSFNNYGHWYIGNAKLFESEI